MIGLPGGTRLRIDGNPTPEEVAAVTLAVDRLLAEERQRATHRHPWQRAARLESVGGRIVRAPADLARP